MLRQIVNALLIAVDLDFSDVVPVGQQFTDGAGHPEGIAGRNWYLVRFKPIAHGKVRTSIYIGLEHLQYDVLDFRLG